MRHQDDSIRYIKGDGDWSIEKHQFDVPYHPKNNAEVSCVVGVCRKEKKVVGIIATVRNISAPYKFEKYEYSIRLILHELVLIRFFGKDEIEIPF